MGFELRLSGAGFNRCTSFESPFLGVSTELRAFYYITLLNQFTLTF